MRKRLLIMLLVALRFASCTNEEKEAADQLMLQVEGLVQSEQYEEALVLLDSLQRSYPDLVKERRRAFEMTKEVRILQGRRDSLLIQPDMAKAEQLADSLYTQFVLIEAPDMPDENILRYKGYDPSANASSPFLDCYLTHDGRLKIVAGVSATYPIKSTNVRVSDSRDETYEVSDTIPYDGGLNYRYEYLSRYYERLTFSPEAAERVAAFVYHAPDHEQLRVVFYKEDGSEGPRFTINSVAKSAIKETYRYYSLLQQILDMNHRLEQHEQRLQQRQLKGQ